MRKINKNLYIIIGVVAAVVVLGVFFWSKQNPGSSIFNTTPLSSTQEENNTPDQSGTPAQSGTPSASATLSYGEALIIYEGRRFQFGFNSTNGCTMSPSYAVLKKGTKIMLDNRASKQMTISLDGTAYNIKAYDFRIVTLTTSAQLPHAVSVDCDTGSNNGQIILQQ